MTYSLGHACGWLPLPLPQLRAVASLKNWPDGILGFEQTGKRRFEMSWTGTLRLLRMISYPHQPPLCHCYTQGS